MADLLLGSETAGDMRLPQAREHGNDAGSRKKGVSAAQERPPDRTAVLWTGRSSGGGVAEIHGSPDRMKSRSASSRGTD
jgi:hypothetical protein